MNKGFSIAKGSDITPQELKCAGVKMFDFMFYPADINVVRKLFPDFLITKSEKNDMLFQFDRLPF